MVSGHVAPPSLQEETEMPGEIPASRHLRACRLPSIQFVSLLASDCVCSQRPVHDRRRVTERG